ncbi:MAG: hypothetical protein LC722_06015 [Actinobacteria bacterium]|nr:hypothetical protein [Actinomycetota bacterium]
MTGGPVLLATSFERPICGTYQHPGAGCEFGYEGDDLETGSFDCRTGPGCLRIARVSHSHMGVIREVPLPEGHAFVGLSNRIPEIPQGAIPPDPGYLELLQLSPTDGGFDLPGYPLEVRLFPDRRLGLALFRQKDVAITRDPVPVDEWFSLVVEVTNGMGATQRLWVLDAAGNVTGMAEIQLDTGQNWPHSERTAQKLGGNTSALEAFDTFHDDWWIARTYLGPVGIDPSGRPIGASG